MQFGKPIETSICNMIANDVILYPGIASCGNFPKKCPVRPGNYYLTNYEVPVDILPPILIETKGKAKVEFVIGEHQILMFIAHGRIDKIIS